MTYVIGTIKKWLNVDILKEKRLIHLKNICLLCHAWNSRWKPWPQYFFSICFVRHDVGTAFGKIGIGATYLNLSNVFRKYANFVNSIRNCFLTVYPTLWFQRSVDDTVIYLHWSCRWRYYFPIFLILKLLLYV